MNWSATDPCALELFGASWFASSQVHTQVFTTWPASLACILAREPCGLQVIDAEMARRKLLEESPIASTQEEPVLFDTSEIPWWAWVRRFHLPEVCPSAHTTTFMVVHIAGPPSEGKLTRYIVKHQSEQLASLTTFGSCCRRCCSI